MFKFPEKHLQLYRPGFCIVQTCPSLHPQILGKQYNSKHTFNYQKPSLTEIRELHLQSADLRQPIGPNFSFKVAIKYAIVTFTSPNNNSVFPTCFKLMKVLLPVYFTNNI